MLKASLDYSEKSGSIGDRFRARRFRFFLECIEPLPTPLRILDVGGKESFWTNRDFQENYDATITLLNLTKEPTTSKNFSAVIGDATDLSQYEDNEFDIVFSNSVIEHLFNLENQKKMIAECLRVGKFHFIQTPNKYFLVEPHLRFPFFNLLPRSLAKLLLTNTTLSLNKKWTDEEAENILNEIKLLSLMDMRRMFPSSNIYKEKLLFLNKSFTAHNFN